MQDAWLQSYAALADFTANHTDILLENNRTCIPDALRPEFYRLFNAARTAFISQRLGALLEKSLALSQAYIKLEKELCSLPWLGSITLDAGLQRYLHQPQEELMKALLNPLFGLLKEETNPENFEAIALEAVSSIFKQLYEPGYQKWIALSVMKHLAPDALYMTPVLAFNPYRGYGTITRTVQQLPPPKPSNHLVFREHTSEVPFMTAEMILHSTINNSHIFFRLGIKRCGRVVSKSCIRREMLPFALNLVSENDLVLLYMAENVNGISLVADAEKICRPDMILVCRTEETWFNQNEIDKIGYYHDTLKPKRGTFILSCEAVPEEMRVELKDGINLLVVGLDDNRLLDVAGALVKVRDGVVGTEPTAGTILNKG